MPSELYWAAVALLPGGGKSNEIHDSASK